MKIRSDMFFLLLTPVSRRVLIFTERDMFDLCEREKQNGRVPQTIEFVHVELPADLTLKLSMAKAAASSEVSPIR